jgi:hypothetical protein
MKLYGLEWRRDTVRMRVQIGSRKRSPGAGSI